MLLETLQTRLRSPFDIFLDNERQEKHTAIRNHITALGVWLDDNIEDGHAKEKMMDALEETSLWAHQAISYN